MYSEPEERHGHVMWDASTFATYHNIMNIAATSKLKRTKVLLGNQADVSVVHPDLLQDLQKAEKTVRINGAGGFQFETSAKGYLHEFPVYASKQTTMNILSFGDIEDELLRTSGSPSYNEAVHLVEDGNITGLPGLTAEDVRRAYELYGQHPAYVRGKTVKKKTGRAIVDDDLVLDEKKQMLYTDVLHLDGEKFLVTVCKPLQLMIQCRIYIYITSDYFNCARPLSTEPIGRSQHPVP